MIITEQNGRMINSKDFYIHDDVLLCMEYDRLSKKLKLKMEKHPTGSGKYYYINFNDVVGFYMTSCDFWLSGECVFDFEYVNPEERVLIPQLESKWKEIPYNYYGKRTYEDFIEVMFTFSSGDELCIACGEIVMQDYAD